VDKIKSEIYHDRKQFLQKLQSIGKTAAAQQNVKEPVIEAANSTKSAQALPQSKADCTPADSF